MTDPVAPFDTSTIAARDPRAHIVANLGPAANPPEIRDALLDPLDKDNGVMNATAAVLGTAEIGAFHGRVVVIVVLLQHDLEFVGTLLWLIDLGEVGVPVWVELAQLGDDFLDRSVERDELAAWCDLNFPLRDDEVRFISKDGVILGSNGIGKALVSQWLVT